MVIIKILMVDPSSIGYGGWNCFATTPENSLLNHGIAILATVAEKSNFPVQVLDCRKLKSWSDFDKHVRDYNPTVVGIGFRTIDFIPAKKMAIRIKKILPNSIIIIGGIHVTFALKDVTDDVSFNNSVNYIIQGEGEVSFIDLLRKLERDEPSDRIIQGIKPNLDELPMVNREFYDYKAELSHTLWVPVTPCITMLFTRGCNFNCAFCQPCEHLLFGNKKRYRSVDNVINELKYLREKYKFKFIQFHDDNFIQNTQWIEEFILKYKQNDFKAKFVIQTRADLVIKHEIYIKSMSEIGLDAISIGFESGSNRILKLLQKGTTVLDNVRAAKICRKYNLKIIANYMYGVPSETKAEIRATKRMIDAINPFFRSYSSFTPMPGTYLFDYCINNGYLPKEFKEKFNPIIGNRYVGDKKIKNIDYKFIRRLELGFMDKLIFRNDFFFLPKNFIKPKQRQFLKKLFVKFKSILVQAVPAIFSL